VIEVHDGRIPLSGRYLRFGTHLTGARPQILLLNKKDLVPDLEKWSLEFEIEESFFPRHFHQTRKKLKNWKKGFEKQYFETIPNCPLFFLQTLRIKAVKD
jgi:ribosome biogenesis GTPase A